MQAQRTFPPGQKGAKKFLESYSRQSICARYHYDEQRRKHGAAVEIIESGWFPTEKPEIVELRV